jgi:hypothetical protein
VLTGPRGAEEKSGPARSIFGVELGFGPDSKEIQKSFNIFKSFSNKQTKMNSNQIQTLNASYPLKQI